MPFPQWISTVWSAFAKEQKIDLVFVAPDDPLGSGHGGRAWRQRESRLLGRGPTQLIIESSKVFSKNLMKKYGIPTAGYEVFSDPKEALAYITEQNQFPIVVKADGLALGQGRY